MQQSMKKWDTLTGLEMEVRGVSTMMTCYAAIDVCSPQPYHAAYAKARAEYVVKMKGLAHIASMLHTSLIGAQSTRHSCESVVGNPLMTSSYTTASLRHDSRLRTFVQHTSTTSTAYVSVHQLIRRSSHRLCQARSDKLVKHLPTDGSFVGAPSDFKEVRYLFYCRL